MTMTGDRELAGQTFRTNVLIDSGAGGIFIDERFIRRNGIPVTPLRKIIQVFNVDGTTNKQGRITHCAWLKLKIGERYIDTRFLISGLGKQDVILGLPWLKQYNPRIDWQKGTLDIDDIWLPRFPGSVFQKTSEQARQYTWRKEYHTTMEGELEETPVLIEKEDNGMDLCALWNYHGKGEELEINAKTSISQRLQQEADQKQEKPKKELPQEYSDFAKIFDQQTSERLPEHKIWDHAIDLKPDFVPQDCKIYPLTVEETEDR